MCGYGYGKARAWEALLPHFQVHAGAANAARILTRDEGGGERWRKECELCILYNNLSGANTHRCGRIREDRGRKRMEERTKKRTGGGRGARCEVRGTLGRCGCGCLVYKTIRYTLSENAENNDFYFSGLQTPFGPLLPPPPFPLPRTTRIVKKYVHSQHDTAHTCCSKMLGRVVGSSPPAPTPPPFVVIQLVPC